MSTATATKAKEIPAQADVRIVGGKTTVKLRAYGRATIQRMDELCGELTINAATNAAVAEAADKVLDALIVLGQLVNSPLSRELGPPSVEVTVDLLSLVLEMDDEPDVTGLTESERTEVCDWARDMHLEASDNDVEAGQAPECLRRLLPAEHYLQTWRIKTNKA